MKSKKLKLVLIISFLFITSISVNGQIKKAFRGNWASYIPSAPAIYVKGVMTINKDSVFISHPNDPRIFKSSFAEYKNDTLTFVYDPAIGIDIKIILMMESKNKLTGMANWLSEKSVATLTKGKKVNNENSLNKQITKKKIIDKKVVCTTPKKSQGETGLCAPFSDISFLESELHRLKRGEFELSIMYIAYYFYIEKALRNIRLHRAKDFGFNGGFNYDAFEIIKKHGVVPLSDYSGMHPEQTEHNHKVFIKEMNIWLNEVKKTAKAGKLDSKWENGRFYCPWLDSLKSILNKNMAKPPVSIVYKKKTISPKQFSDDILSIPYDDYISVTSYSYLGFYKKGELLVSGNWLHRDNFYNVRIDEYIDIIDYALKNGFSLTGDFHITEKLYMSEAGYADLDIKNINSKIDQDIRDNLYENWITNDVHNVHIIGIARDENGKKYYKIKDSVPAEVFPNSPKYFSEDYFRARVLSVMLHKDGIPLKVREKLKID